MRGLRENSADVGEGGWFCVKLFGKVEKGGVGKGFVRRIFGCR